MSDPINPSHYRQGDVECIDAIESATANLKGIEAHCTGTAIKYLWRWKEKNGIEDLDKAIWYITRLKNNIQTPVNEIEYDYSKIRSDVKDNLLNYASQITVNNIMFAIADTHPYLSFSIRKKLADRLYDDFMKEASR